MKPTVHRAFVGLLCGIVSRPFLCSALSSVGLGLSLIAVHADAC